MTNDLIDYIGLAFMMLLWYFALRPLFRGGGGSSNSYNKSSSNSYSGLKFDLDKYNKKSKN